MLPVRCYAGDRTAAEAGLIKSEIHRLTGIARRTLDRIPGIGGGGRP